MSHLPPCPVCGHEPELPRMTPELLWFRCGAAARRGAAMPDGRWAVLAGDLIVTLSDGEWRHYEALCQHSADFARAKYGLEVAA